MPGPLVTVHGAAQLRRSLRRLGDDLSDLAEAHARAGQIVAQAAARRVPRRTGRLAGSIRASRAKTRAVVRAGGAAVPYAGVIHWGSGPRLGRPGPHDITPSLFITRAAADTQPAWLGVYLSEIDRAVARVKGA